MKTRRAIVVMFLLCGDGASKAALAGGQASGFDATGTWGGTFTCRVQVDGKMEKQLYKGETVKISHGENGLFMQVLNGSAPFNYRGTFTPDAKRPDAKGAGTFVECRTGLEIPGRLNEVVSGSFMATPTGDRFTGFSTYNWPDLHQQGGMCRWSFKRMDRADPGLSYPCPTP